MSEPKSCKWCGVAQSGTDGDDILFECGSWHSGSTPEFQWIQCTLNVAEQRIQRAVDWLQRAKGMVHRDSGDWIAIDDVVRAIQILEGQQ